VPEFPKTEEEKIASAAGQGDSKLYTHRSLDTTRENVRLLIDPTETTRDNTSANTGGNSSTIPPTGHGEHGEQKEGIVDKVKDALHMGGSK
jgi:hypothetical protein